MAGLAGVHVEVARVGRLTAFLLHALGVERDPGPVDEPLDRGPADRPDKGGDHSGTLPARTSFQVRLRRCASSSASPTNERAESVDMPRAAPNSIGANSATSGAPSPAKGTATSPNTSPPIELGETSATDSSGCIAAHTRAASTTSTSARWAAARRRCANASTAAGESHSGSSGEAMPHLARTHVRGEGGWVRPGGEDFTGERQRAAVEPLPAGRGLRQVGPPGWWRRSYVWSRSTYGGALEPTGHCPAGGVPVVSTPTTTGAGRLHPNGPVVAEDSRSDVGAA